jgi:hypothetical protein
MLHDRENTYRKLKNPCIEQNLDCQCTQIPVHTCPPINKRKAHWSEKNTRHILTLICKKQVRTTEERTADLGMTGHVTEAKMQAERGTKEVMATQINTETRTETERVIVVVKRREKELTEIVEIEGGTAAKQRQKIRTNQRRGTVM